MEQLTTQATGEWNAIINACELSGEKFTDEAFPPQIGSLTKDAPFDNFVEVQWMRASDLFPEGV